MLSFLNHQTTTYAHISTIWALTQIFCKYSAGLVAITPDWWWATEELYFLRILVCAFRAFAALPHSPNSGILPFAPEPNTKPWQSIAKVWNIGNLFSFSCPHFHACFCLFSLNIIPVFSIHSSIRLDIPSRCSTHNIIQNNVGSKIHFSCGTDSVWELPSDIKD